MNALQIMSMLFVALAIFPGCAEDGSTRASYVPADCPPQVQPAIDPDAAPSGGGDAIAQASEAPQPAEADDAVEPLAKPEVVASNGAGEGDDFVIDLNTASATELMRLPGVGPALAERIIAYRDQRAFKKVDDIKRVRGIGPSKFEKLEPHLTVK